MNPSKKDARNQVDYYRKGMMYVGTYLIFLTEQVSRLADRVSTLEEQLSEGDKRQGKYHLHVTGREQY